MNLRALLKESFSKPTKAMWNGMEIEIGKIYNGFSHRAFSPIGEDVSGKKLRIFDFDDTLVKSNSKIYLQSKDGDIKTLTPAEYAIYEPKPGDKFDFSEFSKVIEPQEIKGVTKLLRRFAKSEGERKIVILTARSAYKPVKDYLAGIGLPGIYVVALGDGDPQKKADWIEDKIRTGYNDVFFIDDSHKNVQAVNGLKKKYPNIKLRVQHVNHEVPKVPATFNRNESIKSLKTLIPKNK
jgi:hypothetical protein